MTKREFIVAIAALECGIGSGLSEQQCTVWFTVLGDLPADALRAAVKRYLQECEYPGLPPAARLRRLAAESTNGIAITAEAAFARVKTARSQWGYVEPGKAKKFLGEAIWSVIEGTGGWSKYCDHSPEQRPMIFSQFRDGWNRQVERRSSLARLSDDVRPVERVNYDGARAQPAAKLLAETIRIGDVA